MPFWIKKRVKSNTSEVCGVTDMDNMRQIKPRRKAVNMKGIEGSEQVLPKVKPNRDNHGCLCEKHLATQQKTHD